MVKHVQKPKQRELNKHLVSYTFSLVDLLSLIGSGIKRNEKGFRVKGAFRSGAYLGCPGKDIYFALYHMSDEQENQVVSALADVIPVAPPGNYEHVAACFRYIYGCFDKQGCLLSNKHRKMIATFTWDEQDKFVGKLEAKLQEINNSFGLLALYEMKAHRLGDKAITTNNLPLMKNMIECYEKSVAYIPDLKSKYKGYSYRHTPYFWCACYLERYNKAKAVNYHIKSLRHLEKYCKEVKKDYRKKVAHSVLYIKKHTKPRKWRALRKEISHFKRKCFSSVGKIL